MLQISKWVEAHKASRGLGWGLAHHHFCCMLLAKVTRPSQIQGVRNKFHLFIGGALKSSCIGYGFREGWRVVFISAVNVLFLPLIKLAKFPYRDRHDFCKMHEAGGMGSPVTLGFPKGTWNRLWQMTLGNPQNIFLITNLVKPSLLHDEA